MTREEIIKEIKTLSDKINSVEKKLDDYFGMLNKDRKSETSENESAIFDLAEIIGGNTDGE